MSRRVRLIARSEVSAPELATAPTNLPLPSVAAPIAVSLDPCFDDSLPLMLREVLGLPARYLLELPLPATLLCSTHEGERCLFRMAGAVAPASPAGVLAFVGREWSALVLAAEHQRGVPATLVGWLRKKASTPAWRLTSAEAIGSMGFAPQPKHWAVQRVLGALGLRLLEVRLGDDSPAEAA